MELQYLKAFEAAAREGNFTKAGERLFTAQSNISTAIRKLERDVGATLFLRGKDGVRLTQKGEELLILATRILDLVGEAGNINRQDGPPRGRFVIGAMESTAVTRLSPIIAKFIKKYPEIRIDLRTSDTAIQRERILRGELDCAFFGEEIEESMLESISVFPERLVLAVTSSSPARRIQDLKVADFLVLQKGCSYRKRLETILVKRGFSDSGFHEVSGIHTLLACVHAGMGAGMFPVSFLKYHRIPGLRVLHLSESESKMTTFLAWRKERFLSLPARVFIETVKANRPA